MSAELIAKLESASEGSRELDALIWAHFQPEKVKVSRWYEPYGDRSGRSQVEFTLPPKRSRLVTSDTVPYRHAEPVTTSVDAALALAERVLPGFDVSVGTHWCALLDIRGPHATVSRRMDDLGNYDAATTGTASANTPALAICAALLRASAAEGAG